MIAIGIGKKNLEKTMKKSNNTLVKHTIMTTCIMTVMMFLTIGLLPEILSLSESVYKWIYMITLGIYWFIVKCKTRVIIISQILAVILSIALMELFL